jgi:hypothetical protein
MNKTEKIKFDSELNDRALLRGVLKKQVKVAQADVIFKVCDGELSGDEALAEIAKVEKLFDVINDEFRNEQFGFNSGETPYSIEQN